MQTLYGEYMATPPRKTRAYKSPLRAEKAAETRRLITTAAGEVFSERGYAGATMAQIAERAGVSIESVHAVGTKPALLILAFKQAYAGASGWKTILDEPDLLRIMSTEGNDEAIMATPSSSLPPTAARTGSGPPYAPLPCRSPRWPSRSTS